MSERFPPLERSQLSGEALALHDNLHERLPKVYRGPGPDAVMTWCLPSGALLGPFAPGLRTPSILQSFTSHAFELLKIPMTDRLREIIIITVTGFYGAKYPTYAHERIGVEAGLSKAQAKILASSPMQTQSLSEGEIDVIRMTLALLERRGPLPDDIWNPVCATWGEAVALGITHYVGYYAYASLFVNGCGVPVPPGESMDI